LLIDEILDYLLRGMESIVHLIKDGDYFKALVPVNLLSSSNAFYLGFKMQEDGRTLLDTAKHILKISSQEDMPTLIRRSLPGLPLEYVPEPPPGLPRRANVVYFRIEHTSKYWENIRNNANICVFWAGAPEDVSIELVILKQ